MLFPRSQKVRRGRRGKRRARERRRRGDGPSLRTTSKNPGITLPNPLLPRGVSVRRRQREGGGVRSSLLRGNPVAAVYSLSLISELCRFCLHSGFSNLSIFLVLTELSSPETSNLDLCSWGGSGAGLYVGLQVPLGTSARPCHTTAREPASAAEGWQPSTTSNSLLHFTQWPGRLISLTQILPWSPDFTSALCLTLLQFLSLLHQFKVHSSPKTCSQAGNLRRPPWSLQPTLTTPVAPVLLHIWFRSQEFAAHSFCPQLNAGSFRAFTMPFTFFSLFPNPRLGSLMD